MSEFRLLDDQVFPFDARGVAKRFRHAAIFGALDALNNGETMRFVNDHDPLPLLEQIGRRYGQNVRMAYLSRDPGQIVIDFQKVDPTAQPAPRSGGCGGGGGGCGCSGG
ncbi:MAG: DUF2249 domain-containing protein [Rhodocyclaceae bacterium]|jgi:uncharacterized protein (DUF2249 family)|nr:DUF2249 domain-containing protein [Rhodocyclaceae bacterium]